MDAHVKASRTTSWSKIAEELGVTEGGVRHWRNGTREIKLTEFFALCKAAGASPEAILRGDHAAAAPPDEAMARDGREEILLHLYRGLFSLQQERLMVSLRALFHANQITRKEMGQTQLRGVSDDQVRKAFGDAPFHRMKKLARRMPRRDTGTAMDDFFEE